MNVTPFRSNLSAPLAMKQDLAISPRSSALQTCQLASPLMSRKGSPVAPGLGALQRDGFEMGPKRGAQLEKLLEGAVSSLMQTVSALQQMLQASQSGGAKPVSGPGASQGATPAFSDSSFTPGSHAASSPVELNPAGPAELNPAKPAELNPAEVSGASQGSPSGEAKLGPGMPPALGQYKSAIESAAAKTGVPAAMLAGQIWQESRGNLSAVSTNGGNGMTDTGLMQVNPNTFQELQAKHPELQGKNLADPETNILAGAFYMKDMKEQFGSFELALRAYNSGPNGVDRSNPNAIPAGTGDATYVQKVKQFWDTISTGKGSLPA